MRATDTPDTERGPETSTGDRRAGRLMEGPRKARLGRDSERGEGRREADAERRASRRRAAKGGSDLCSCECGEAKSARWQRGGGLPAQARPESPTGCALCNRPLASLLAQRTSAPRLGYRRCARGTREDPRPGARGSSLPSLSRPGAFFPNKCALQGGWGPG